MKNKQTKIKTLALVLTAVFLGSTAFTSGAQAGVLDGFKAFVHAVTAPSKTEDTKAPAATHTKAESKGHKKAA